MATSILLLNGPNLNLLGSREPSLYGTQTLAQIEQELSDLAREKKLALSCFQSNHEGALIDRIHACPGDGVDFIIINAGALTHSSIALRDALIGVAIPFIEVHISNIYRRENFRHASLLADCAIGSIIGLGAYGYRLALQFAAGHASAKA
ncbi:3-dehydroquinate dehydratase [Burkholderiales bacterium]|nr:3-dehydroquinate dehydratase [Burkholderiales bacterium]